MTKKLADLRAHANSALIEFVRTPRAMFRRRANQKSTTSIACRGLTKLLASAFPVPKHDGTSCTRCSLPAARAFRTKRERSWVVPVRSNAPLVKCRGRGDRAHGIVVDEQIEEYVRTGTLQSGTADPCTLSLLAYLRDKGWAPIATQVPIYSEQLGGFATAIDLLCTDAETRSQLILVEVKSTRLRGKPALLDECYRTSVGKATGALRGLPLSRYTQHQVQLWCMRYTVERECGVKLDASVVLRTSPHAVDCYPLNSWFDGRERALVRRFHGTSRRFKPKRRRRPQTAVSSAV